MKLKPNIRSDAVIAFSNFYKTTSGGPIIIRNARKASEIQKYLGKAEQILGPGLCGLSRSRV